MRTARGGHSKRAAHSKRAPRSTRTTSLPEFQSTTLTLILAGVCCAVYFTGSLLKYILPF